MNWLPRFGDSWLSPPHRFQDVLGIVVALVECDVNQTESESRQAAESTERAESGTTPIPIDS